MGLLRAVDPAPLIELAQAKLHLRVDDDNVVDDDLIQLYAAAAVDRVEGHLSRAVLEQTFQLTLDHFPFYGVLGRRTGYELVDGAAATLGGFGGAFDLDPTRLRRSPWRWYSIRLPRPSLMAVTSINYIDPDGNPQTLDPAQYVVDTTGLPGSISPAYGVTWPATRAIPDAVTILFTAGFSNDPTKIPAAVRAAVLLSLADLYMNRESGADLSVPVRNLLAPYVYREAV